MTEETDTRAAMTNPFFGITILKKQARLDEGLILFASQQTSH